MMVSWLRVLLDNISSFLSLSTTHNLYSNPAHKYYTSCEHIAKLLKPVLENLVASNTSPDELLSNAFEELSQYFVELREQFQSWQPLSSRILYVLRIESLASKLKESGLKVFQLLKHYEKHFSPEMFSPSFEEYIELVKSVGTEEISNHIEQALIDQRDGTGPTSQAIVKIAESVGLYSNKEILIEGVILANMKEDTELLEKNTRIEFIDGLVHLITKMHAYLTKIKQSELPLPPDFTCPLSLDLMTDPVIVASGLTYERVYIEKWMEMGLMYCPKTGLALSHTNLIPNFIVKAFTDSWCESHNVTPPDPLELIHSTHPFPLLVDSDDLIASSSSENSHIDLLDATKCEESRYALSRSTSAPGLVSQVISKTGTSTTWRGHKATVRESSIEKEVKKLIEDLKNHNVDIHREAAARMRILTRISTENRALIAKCGAIDILVNLIDHSSDERVQMEAVTCILNLATISNNKLVIVESGALGPLVRVLKEGLLVEAIENAAAALVSLSLEERNCKRIAKAGAIEPLVDLLGNGSPLAKKDASSVLFNLTTRNEDKAKAIRAGAVRHLVGMMMDAAAGQVEKAVAVLANLSTIKEGTVAIGEEEGAIGMLVEVVELGSGRGRENATVALLMICMHESRFCNRVMREGVIPPLVALSRSGNVRARDKAQSLLSCLQEYRRDYRRRR